MENFVKVECCGCGVIFAVSSDFQSHWKKTKQVFYCPNGHSQSYRKSTAEIEKERADSLSAQLFSEKFLVSQKQREIDKLQRKLKRKIKS